MLMSSEPTRDRYADSHLLLTFHRAGPSSLEGRGWSARPRT